MLYVCLQFQEKITYFINFDEFSYLQSDDHLLQIMPALRFDTGGWALSRCGLVETGAGHHPTRSDGIRKKCWHFCHPIIPSSHHPIISSHHLRSHHPIISGPIIPSSETCFKIIIPSGTGPCWLEALQDAHGLGLEGEESGNPISEGYVVTWTTPHEYKPWRNRLFVKGVPQPRSWGDEN